MKTQLTPITFAILMASSTYAVAEDARDEVDNNVMERIVVTTTREAKPTVELTESVGVIDEQALKEISPAHPSEALNRIAGVHINSTGGEGHMTAIRQPITTSGVYLFLEDGIPTRPTGFFNHNGLYEINIPQSSRIEVIKGPGSALYGSDAIGGVINSITKAAPESLAVETNLEVGENGWTRGLFSIGNAITEDTSARIDLNITDNEGYRDDAEYDRMSFTSRVDSQLSENWDNKTVFSYTDVDQSGLSSLEYDDYKNNPKQNYYLNDLGYREMTAIRLSSEFSYQVNDDALFTVTPFYRNNDMDMMPSWMMSYDPNLRNYEFESFGLMTKYRQTELDGAFEWIVGVDMDYTPSSYTEDKIDVTKEGDYYVDYTKTGVQNYAFDADQTSISPYVHTEWQATEHFRVTAGVRYDYFEVDYTDKLAASQFDYSHLRPESQKVDYDNFSPKLGAVYQFNDDHNVYFSYRHAFRAPTVGALFRPGSAKESTELEPVTSTSVEIGFRGQINNRFSYEVAIYDMTIEDEILSVIEDDTRVARNAGETEHKGIELGFDIELTEELQFGISGSYTEQTYEDFAYVYFSRDCFCSKSLNFAGNDVSKAPETMANARLAYYPKYAEGLRVELEVSHLGEYYTDQTNTQKYGGHDLVNLRARYEIDDNWAVYFRGINLGDKLYSNWTSNQVGSTKLTYRPGLPRTFYAGFNYQF
ncbi:TonB-dependent receptor [Catenovulum sp. SM1970]|uniref:TonB-dependent receptor n=1 Tax=Marinifaba aquimaris TaxID=2741323 RepID=UPI001572DCDA|nr:TonB-dependent receptor [Marinifaba aquimaris]NTS76414.1 TonB-dependent receptor [Marinifaba aquimaris]